MNQRRQYLPCLAFLAIVLLLSGCSQQKPVMSRAIRVRPMPFTAVSTMDPMADVSSTVSFTWAPRMQEIQSDPHEAEVLDKETIQNAISKALREKGYEYTWRAGLADLRVGYLVVMNGALSGKEINDRFGIQPGMNLQAPDTVRYEKGTLVIDIIDMKTGRTAWRGALQGFADHRISKEDRQQRFDDIVMFMLARFPARAGYSQ
jgi:Domain of unknown function (DUF4136)